MKYISYLNINVKLVMSSIKSFIYVSVIIKTHVDSRNLFPNDT